MKKDQRRKAAIAAKSKAESLKFQALWGARQKMGEVPAEVENRINEEIMVLNNMGLAEDILTLKNALDSLRRDLNIVSEPSKGILAGSVVAYCLDLEPTNPLETGSLLNPSDFLPPLQLTISFDNEVRNQAVDWLKQHGFTVTTLLGQPMLKLPNIRVSIRRVLKP